MKFFLYDNTSIRLLNGGGKNFVNNLDRVRDSLVAQEESFTSSRKFEFELQLMNRI